jgi:hypothetical protein
LWVEAPLQRLWFGGGVGVRAISSPSPRRGGRSYATRREFPLPAPAPPPCSGCGSSDAPRRLSWRSITSVSLSGILFLQAAHFILGRLTLHRRKACRPYRAQTPDGDRTCLMLSAASSFSMLSASAWPTATCLSSALCIRLCSCISPCVKPTAMS